MMDIVSRFNPMYTAYTYQHIFVCIVYGGCVVVTGLLVCR